MTTSGTITEFAFPAASSYPSGVVAGPDGNVWVTERLVNKIAKIVVREPSRPGWLSDLLANQAATTLAAFVLGAAFALIAVRTVNRRRRRGTVISRG
jgi:streptogramin lyase